MAVDKEWMVSFVRRPNHKPDRGAWNKKNRPRWAVQAGFKGLLERDVDLQVNLHAQFLSDCDVKLWFKARHSQHS